MRRTAVSRAPGSPPLADPLHAVNRALTTPGNPLGASTRTAMEARLGADFSGVRVRSSAPSAAAVGSPTDAAEHAADRVATRTPDAPKAPGSVDLSAVRVHTDDAAAASARAIGARAYTLGSHVVFGQGEYSPSTARGQRVLTHELAHVAEQQRTGGSGVVRRFTAFTADDQTSGKSQGWLHPDGNKLRVADDGMLAAEDNGWGPGRSKRAWSVPEKLPESNKILADQKSIAQLRIKPSGQSISGTAPQSGATSKLQEVEPIKRVGHDDSTTTGAVVGGVVGGLALGAAGAGIGFGAAGEKSDDQLKGALIGGAIGAVIGAVAGAFSGAAIEKRAKAFELTSDCGTAAREVMGSATEGKKDVCMIPGAAGGEEALTARPYHGGNPTTPEKWSEEIFKKEFGSGLSRAEAYARYNALSTESKDGKPSEKDAFDRKYGINKYAVPRVGQGITTSSEKDMPGFMRYGRTWNFHFAAPVLQSGHDYITLESAAGWGATDWIFFMYGPEAQGQSFHEFHVGTRTHGNKATSMVVQPEP